MLAVAGSPRSAGAATDSDPDWAGAFIRRAGNDIAAITGANLSAADRAARLRAEIDAVVDVDGTARFCLGRFWRFASTAQQNEYLGLFHAVLVRAVLARVSRETADTTKAQVAVGHPEGRGDEIRVPTAIRRANSPPFQVIWVVRADPANPRIIDVVAEGTSLRVTIRDDYNTFLTRNRNDIEIFLRALRRQACDGCAPDDVNAGR